MVSRYVQPGIKFSNSNVYRQAKSLQLDHGVEVEILTWPCRDGWQGSMPQPGSGMSIPPMQVEVEGLKFHVIDPFREWNERVLRSQTWEEAVRFGARILDSMCPDIVHLQHWSGLWWMLEAAQRCGIPTVYSNHDWGIACLQTILVMGDNALCDGRVSYEKCAVCIWKGRGILGKANEVVAQTAAGRSVVNAIYRTRLGFMLNRVGAVRMALGERVQEHLARHRRVLGNLKAMFVPSEFARRFFVQCGVKNDRVQVLPWYHDPVSKCKIVVDQQPFTITYVGRLSPEKGVHQIFEAFGRLTAVESITLRIAGANTSSYAAGLMRKYESRIGLHRVEWLGWSEIEPLFLSTDVSVVPSTWIDNTPLSLVESLSYSVPVVATKVPPIQELVIEGQTGYLADYNSVDSLASAIRRAVMDRPRIRSGTLKFPRISTCREYTLALKNAYTEIAGQDRST